MALAVFDSGPRAGDLDCLVESAQFIDQTATQSRDAAPDPSARHRFSLCRIESARLRDLGGKIGVEFTDGVVERAIRRG